MKKIITSLGMIVFAAAIVAGGTGAFFSDVETSTGNVFTAGAIDLTVDSEAHYNGSICLPNATTTDPTDYMWLGGTEYPVGLPCTGTWEATNLGAQTFFNYTDVKPGDEGENTISLHIDSNPAWACVDVTLTKNDDMTVNEPEDAEVLELDTPLSEPDLDLFDGELAQNMKFAAWLDQGTVPGWQNSDDLEGNDDAGEGDNVWQGDPAEPLLFSNQSGPASDVLGGKTYTLADSVTNGGLPMAPGVTNYLGLQWCAGTQVVNTTLDTITCDGSTLGNIVQTDSMVANIAFRVEQARNNEDFTCTPRVAPVTTLSLEKVIQQDQTDPVTEAAWTLTADGVSQDLVGSEGQPSVTNVPVAAGSYTLTESNLEGFTQTNLLCPGAASLVGNVVTITEGQNVTCTFFNTENTLSN